MSRDFFKIGDIVAIADPKVRTFLPYFREFEVVVPAITPANVAVVRPKGFLCSDPMSRHAVSARHLSMILPVEKRQPFDVALDKEGYTIHLYCTSTLEHCASDSFIFTPLNEPLQDETKLSVQQIRKHIQHEIESTRTDYRRDWYKGLVNADIPSVPHNFYTPKNGREFLHGDLVSVVDEYKTGLPPVDFFEVVTPNVVGDVILLTPYGICDDISDDYCDRTDSALFATNVRAVRLEQAVENRPFYDARVKYASCGEPGDLRVEFYTPSTNRVITEDVDSQFEGESYRSPDKFKAYVLFRKATLNKDHENGQSSHDDWKRYY